MRQRWIACATSCAVLSLAAADVEAHGAWLAEAPPARHRIAIAASGTRVTVWSDVTYTGSSSPVGLVVPVPPGASLDLATAGWFEALDAATAPRVVPPPGEPGSCDGSGSGLVQSTEPAIAPTAGQNDVQVLADAAAVAAWASAQGLTLPASVEDELAAMSGKRFLALSLFGGSGQLTSPTVRVVLPAASPVLPLALVQSSQPVEVTTWLIGEGRGRLTTGGPDIEHDPSAITWNASTTTSDYLQARDALLAGAAPGSGVVETAGHDALVFETSLGRQAIPAIAREYFVRAAAKGDVESSLADACAEMAAAALGASGVVWDACPRADLGVVDGTDTCVETPVGGGTDPGDLRCDPLGDDLAVGLSGLVPQQTWITRRVMRLDAGQAGADWPLSFSSGPVIAPIVTCGSVDASECPQGGTPSGAGPSGGGVLVVRDPDPDVGCGCSDTSDTVDDDDDGATSGGGEGAGGETGEGGSGDTSGGDEDDGRSSDDGDCSGDTTEEQDDGDGCDCGGTETETEEGDSSDGSSSGETSSSDDGCGSDDGSSSDDGCDCGSGKCAIGDSVSAKPGKKMRRRLSPIALAFVALMIPLRRATKKKRPSA